MRLVRLSYLAPDITQAILDGRQQRDLTADKLLAHSRFPLAWHDQRKVFGFKAWPVLQSFDAKARTPTSGGTAAGVPS